MPFLKDLASDIAKGPLGRLHATGRKIYKNRKKPFRALKQAGQHIIHELDPRTQLMDLGRRAKTVMSAGADILNLESGSGLPSTAMSIGALAQPEFAPFLLTGAAALRTGARIKDDPAGALQGLAQRQLASELESRYGQYKTLGRNAINNIGESSIVNRLRQHGKEYTDLLPQADPLFKYITTNRDDNGNSLLHDFMDKGSFDLRHTSEQLHKEALRKIHKFGRDVDHEVHKTLRHGMKHIYKDGGYAHIPSDLEFDHVHALVDGTHAGYDKVNQTSILDKEKIPFGEEQRTTSAGDMVGRINNVLKENQNFVLPAAAMDKHRTHTNLETRTNRASHGVAIRPSVARPKRGFKRNRSKHEVHNTAQQTAQPAENNQSKSDAKKKSIKDRKKYKRARKEQDIALSQREDRREDRDFVS